MPRLLTPNFSLDELVASQIAARERIDNTPDAAVLANLKRLAGTLEQIRDLLGGVPINISSGYRSPALNRRIKGSSRSQHMLGLATDFTAPRFGTPLMVARKIASSAIEFDQIIHEFGAWVHLGLASADAAPRRESLSIFAKGRYLTGLHGPSPDS